MGGTNPLLLGLSSALMFAAAFLGARWAGPAWDDIMSRRIADFRPKMRLLNMNDVALPMYLRLWGFALLGTFLIFWLVLGMLPLALPAVLLVWVGPGFVLNRLVARHRMLLQDQMVSACVGLANAARAGLPLAQGLESVSQETPEPLATELRRIVFEYQHGRSLPEAIQDTQRRLDLDAFTLFAAAILICLERGGRVTDSLERIAGSLREHQRLMRKLAADTASGRKVITLLALFPGVFLAGFYVTDPETTGLIFTTIPGQIVLLAVVGLDWASVKWAQKIMSWAESGSA